MFANAQLSGSQIQGTHDGLFIARGSSMNCTPEPSPDDDIAAGDDLSTGVHIANDHHVAWMLDDLP